MGIEKISPVVRTWGVLVSTLAVLASVLALDVQESAAIAPLTELNATRLVPTDELGPQSFDQFGASVSVCGDTAVVGSPGTSFDEGGAGTARVFQFDGTGWELLQTLLDEEGDAEFDEFGRSVAVSGKTMVIGAPGALVGAFNSTIRGGLVFVYERLELDELALEEFGPWQLTDVLESPDPFPDERFGSSVAISEDHIVVGTDPDEFIFEFGSGPFDSSGSVYVYERGLDGVELLEAGAPWGFLQELEPGFAGDGDGDGDGEGFFGVELFGSSVAIHRGTIVVGAPVADGFGPQGSGFYDTGSAYIFSYIPGLGLFTSTGHLTPESDFEEFGLSRFGTSVDVVGRTIVVGAPLDGESFRAGSVELNGFEIETGRAFVFERRAQWGQTQELYPPDEGTHPGYGTSVAISSDSGDVVVVGAPEDPDFLDGVNGPAGFGSAAFIYERALDEGGTFFNNTHITSFPFNRFGDSVDTTSVFTCVGSPFFDGFGSGFGGAHVLRLFTPPEPEESFLQIRRARVRGRLGRRQLLVAAQLDVGKPDFGGPAVIDVLDDTFDVTDFTESVLSAGNSEFLAVDPVRVAIRESRFGSSNTRFLLRVPQFVSPGESYELPIAYNGTTAVVIMNDDRFARYSRHFPGSQIAPGLSVQRLTGQLTGKKRDTLLILGKLATDGTVPEDLPGLVVAVGDTFRQEIGVDRLRRTSTRLSFSQRYWPGVVRLRIDYASGRFVLALRNVNLGCPEEGPVPVQVTLGDCRAPDSISLCVGSVRDRLVY